MRPILRPGLRRLWHDASTLQLGVDPERAIVLTDLSPPLARLLDELDGSRTLDQVRHRAGSAGRDLVDLLERSDLLEDATAPGGSPPMAPIERERLRPDQAALSLTGADPGRARRVLAGRRRARVLIRGGGRVGAQIATLLAAAGIGQVLIDDPAVTTPADVSPGGLRLDDVGRPRAVAVGHAMARVSRARPGERDAPVELIVLAPAGPPVIHPGECLDLAETGPPHLVAGVLETTGIVGPLVVPARTACLHCQHLHRHDVDPSWPVLALQLGHRPAPGPDPCEITLAGIIAGLAAMQALSFLDLAADPAIGPVNADADAPTADITGVPVQSGPPAQETFATSHHPNGRLPVTAGGTLELAVPDWRIRRRTWPVHPNCPCPTARSAAVRAGADPGPGEP